MVPELLQGIHPSIRCPEWAWKFEVVNSENGSQIETLFHVAPVTAHKIALSNPFEVSDDEITTEICWSIVRMFRIHADHFAQTN